MTKIPPTIFSWLNGISDLLLVAASWIFAIYYTRNYFQAHKKYQLVTALVGYCYAMGFSGILVSFIFGLATGHPESVETVTHILSYSTIGIGFAFCMYLVWDIFFDPKYRKPSMILFGIISILWYFIVFIPWQFDTVNDGELLLDESLMPLTMGWWVVLILMLMVFYLLGVSFFKLRKKISGPERVKATYLSMGFVLLSICVIADTMWITEFIFIVRFVLIGSLYMWHKGF